MDAASLNPLDVGKPAADRFTPFFATLAFLFMLLVVFSPELDRMFNLYLLLVPLILVPGVVLLILFVAALVLNVIRRRWRRALSVIVAPLLAATPLVFCDSIGVTPTWLRFAFTRGQYEQEIALIERQSSLPLLKSFDWGETGGATGPNIFLTLVYDKSDELGLVPYKRSQSWIERAEKEPRLRSVARDAQKVYVQNMGRHFYVVTEIY